MKQKSFKSLELYEKKNMSIDVVYLHNLLKTYVDSKLHLNIQLYDKAV
jgi:hypothetical protein